MSRQAYDIITADVYSVEQTFSASCVDIGIRFDAVGGFAFVELFDSVLAL